MGRFGQVLSQKNTVHRGEIALAALEVGNPQSPLTRVVTETEMTPVAVNFVTLSVPSNSG